jgi:carnitine monooxygenase subunit
MNVIQRGIRDIGKFSRDPEYSYTLPASYYRDPEIFARETEQIFFRAWNYACHVSQVREPGSYATTQVGDQGIAVVRGHDGVLRAFYNVCSHRAHELLKGCGKAKIVTCPYHAWSYHLDGKLRSATASRKVERFEAEEFALKPVRVDEYAGFVYVNLDPTAKPLSEQAGELGAGIRQFCPEVESLKFACRIVYEVKANWKTVVDNYLECYHCSVAHPAFVDLVDVKNYRTKTYDMYSTHISPPGRSDNAAYCLPPGQEGNFAGFWVWPNVALNAFPGSPNISALHMMPTGPETTLEHFDFFFASETPSEAEALAIKYVDEVLQPEDIGLMESVQRGLHSRGYHQGRFMVDKERTHISEHGLHHFHSLILDALGELPQQ